MIDGWIGKKCWIGAQHDQGDLKGLNMHFSFHQCYLNKSVCRSNSCTRPKVDVLSSSPLYFDVVEDCGPLADRLWTQWDLNIFTPEVVHVHQVVILDGQSHVVFPTLWAKTAEKVHSILHHGWITLLIFSISNREMIIFYVISPWNTVVSKT